MWLELVLFLPFMAVVADQSLLETNKYLSELEIGQSYGFKSPNQFLTLLGIVMLYFNFDFANIQNFYDFVQVRFALMREHSIGKRLMESYLRQPYSWFVNKNSSDIEKTILSEVNYVIHNTIYPFMELFSQFMVVLAIFSFLILLIHF